MDTFQLTAPDGQKYRIQAESPEKAKAAFDYMMNPPPEGAMIHEAGRSYIAGKEGPTGYVKTEGMAPGVGMAAEKGGIAPGTKEFTEALRQLGGDLTPPRADLKSGLPSREEAAAALRLRQTGSGAIPGLPIPLLGGSMSAQGFTGSAADEAASLGFGIGGALQGAPFQQSYGLAQEAQRQSLAQQREEHPIRSGVLQAGGALAQVPALGPIANLGSELPLIYRSGVNAISGGLLGGGEGFASGSGLEDRLQEAKKGGLLGAGIGAAVTPVIQGATSLAKNAIDYFQIDKTLKQLVGAGKPAADAVKRALAADDAYGGAGARSIAEAGPEAMLVDAGPSARGTLDTAMQRGGPATLTASRAVRSRTEAGRETLTDALDAALGKPPPGVSWATEQIRKGSEASRDAAYKAAYNTPIDYSNPKAFDLQEMLAAVPHKVIAKANELMQLERQSSKQIIAEIGDNGQTVYRSVPDVRQIDYITRGLRHLAEAGEDAGAMGGMTQFSRGYTKLAGEIRGVTKELAPSYGKALNAGQDTIEQVQALKFGREMLNPLVERDEVAMAIRNMSADELKQTRQGIRSHIDNLMANTKVLASDPDNMAARQSIDALRLLNTDASVAKLRTVLDPVQAAQLQNELRQATKSIELFANVQANSKTFGRGAVAQAVETARSPGVVGSLKEGEYGQALRRIPQILFGTTPQDKLRGSDETYRQIAELLTAQRGPRAMETMQLLDRAYQTAPQNAVRAQEIGTNVGLLGAIPGYEAAREWWRERR